MPARQSDGNTKRGGSWRARGLGGLILWHAAQCSAVHGGELRQCWCSIRALDRTGKYRVIDAGVHGTAGAQNYNTLEHGIRYRGTGLRLWMEAAACSSLSRHAKLRALLHAASCAVGPAVQCQDQTCANYFTNNNTTTNDDNKDTVTTAMLLPALTGPVPEQRADRGGQGVPPQPAAGAAAAAPVPRDQASRHAGPPQHHRLLRGVHGARE